MEEIKQKIKNNKILIMAIASVIVIAIIGIVIFFVINKKNNTIEVAYNEGEINDEIIEKTEDDEENNEENEDEDVPIGDESYDTNEEDELNNDEIATKPSNTTTNSNSTAGYKSKYYIKVNYGQNVVTVYEKDSSGNYTVPIKAMVCSCGTATPKKGVYLTSPGMKWGNLIGGLYAKYSVRIVGSILFHTVPYTRKGDSNSLEYWEYDKLGTTASAGCIRLTVIDCLWIYNNCKSGVPVEFYSDSNPGPLGKPSAQKISEYTEVRGWDPTDPDSDNPWIEYNKNKKDDKETIVQDNNNEVNSNVSNTGDNNNNNSSELNNAQSSEINQSTDNNTVVEDSNTNNDNSKNENIDEIITQENSSSEVTRSRNRWDSLNKIRKEWNFL